MQSPITSLRIFVAHGQSSNNAERSMWRSLCTATTLAQAPGGLNVMRIVIVQRRPRDEDGVIDDYTSTPEALYQSIQSVH